MDQFTDRFVIRGDLEFWDLWKCCFKTFGAYSDRLDNFVHRHAMLLFHVRKLPEVAVYNQRLKADPFPFRVMAPFLGGVFVFGGVPTNLVLRGPVKV